MATHRYALGGAVAPVCQNAVVTIGNFDGVHRGHQVLVADAVRQARAMNTAAVAVTFDPHPTQLLRPESFQPLLTAPADRALLLQSCGIDHVLILQTSPALLALRAAEFFEQIVVGQLRARAIVEGFNFGFGKNREGTLAMLQTLGAAAGIAVVLAPPVEFEGQPVSTSRVRHDAVAGNVEHARELLGRPYRLSGTVGVGARRGATLGFPTANLTQVDNLIPGNGVYAARAVLLNDPAANSYRAAVNVGPNPTFGDQARKVEVHLLDYQGDLYDARLAIHFLKKLRDPRPFGSAEELIVQIRSDVAQVRELASRAADVG